MGFFSNLKSDLSELGSHKKRFKEKLTALSKLLSDYSYGDLLCSKELGKQKIIVAYNELIEYSQFTNKDEIIKIYFIDSDIDLSIKLALKVAERWTNAVIEDGILFTKTFATQTIELLITNDTKQNLNSIYFSESFEKSFSNEIMIGDQIFMTKNLNLEHFRNGDIIPEIRNDEEWRLASKYKKAGWCNYKNDQKNGEMYGKLYNWYAVQDKSGLAPAGWHIPSDKEWEKLSKHLYILNNKCTDIDKSGFAGLPSGTRTDKGEFNGLGVYGNMWSSTEIQSNLAWYYWFSNVSSNMVGWPNSKNAGNSVRCIKN